MKPYSKTDSYTLYLGDAWEVLDTLPENSIDAVVTDPPYEIGFMNKGWDNTGIAFNRTTWEKVLRVLKPGGHILAFNHSRTFHRMAVAIEDAGFEIRDTIMWLYGSGFPKSHDISKAIDKRGGKSINFEEFRDAVKQKMKEQQIKTSQLTKALGNQMLSHYLTAGSQPAIPNYRDYKIIRDFVNLGDSYDDLFAEEAEREVVGHKQSSLGGTVAAGERNQEIIDYHKNKIVDITTPSTEQAKQWEGWGTALKPAYEPILLARKPIPTTVADNVLTHGVGGLNIDECRVGTEVTTTTRNGDSSGTRFDFNDKRIGSWNNPPGRFPANIIHDGSEEVVEGFPETGISSGGRIGNAGSDLNMMGTTHEKGDPGFGDSGSASRFFYTAKASKKDRDEGTTSRNIHPTVKPTDLMQYLIRLIAPKGATVLDIFMGSGSTGKAAMIENVERDANYHFIGIDRTEEYMPIAEARIEFGRNYAEEKPKADGVVHQDQIDLFSLL
jgi:DNA modification methylase